MKAIPAEPVQATPVEVTDILIAYDDVEEAREEPAFVKPPEPAPARRRVVVIQGRRAEELTASEKGKVTTAQVPEPGVGLLALSAMFLALRRQRP